MMLGLCECYWWLLQVMLALSRQSLGRRSINCENGITSKWGRELTGDEGGSWHKVVLMMLTSDLMT